ncbi:MAG: hypothetical protein ACRD8O_18120 [Bryobacteraceae bacterium]
MLVPLLWLGLAAPLAAQVRAVQSPEQLAQQATTMSPEEAAKLETQIEKAPGDWTARAKLIGYYYYQWMPVGEQGAKAARRRHVFWMIQNQPELPLAGIQEAVIEPQGSALADLEGWQKARELWMTYLEGGSAQTLGNLAKYFQLSDKELAEKALLRATALEPANGEWTWRLGFLYAIAIIGVDGVGLNGQPSSIDPFARESPFAIKARKELDTAQNAYLLAVAANVISRYGTMLAPSDRARMGHLEDAERLLQKAAALDPGNPSWKQMLSQMQAWKLQMRTPGR